MLTVVIDYGMSNLCSLTRALEECGSKVLVSEHPGDLKAATHIVLPGVGAFADGMKNLNASGFASAIREEVLGNGIPLLGICLGMQLLADTGDEGGPTAGLGLVSGAVKRLSSGEHERIPHVGWNEVFPAAGSPFFAGIPEGTDFYFVHSYHFVPTESDSIAARTPYCGGFVSAIRRLPIWGVQFHPEKSQLPGFRVLHNFLRFRG
ncbi:MAG: imidazole glycerol phosphate synthase subunit HisH [Deltaproteobacteria bacterium]|nr:imidazole glycerol phosphate synthase subunit HisH [Deltaproteobacteria bacterium]